MSFKCFFNSHFVFVSQIHISFLQGNSFRFAVITKDIFRFFDYPKDLFRFSTPEKV